MTQFIPLSLSGNSLGERHRLLNSLVEDTFRSKMPFESIQNLPETTPVDRLFKIDLASKHRDVAYIITNLKDPDMLYVSRALKSTWLLEAEHTNIFNPSFLEEQLFPDMTPAAVSKVQYWLLRNLRNPGRCRDFYLYYKDIKFKTAIRFLWHCSNEYILEESETIMSKMEPQYLKVLSEKCPQLTKCFFRRLEHDRDVLSNYLGNEKKYFNNLKFILKSDPETFFDVIEKYCNTHIFRSFSAGISKYVMFNHKDRFLNKSELYTAWLLDINVIARYLSTEEIKDVILKLAKAEYLGNLFTYKKVEPLIKKLHKDERVTFKKYIFVDKAFGEKAKKWPYPPPTSPVLEKIPTYNLFLDLVSIYDINPWPIEQCCRGKMQFLCGKSRSENSCHRIVKSKTLLDRFFDKYRFSSFESTLFELRKRLRAESSPRNREYMLLVLVSKSGGREDSLRSLFKLLAQYKNEPVHLRAAIVRSLVTRAFAWRLPTDLWKYLLEWGHGLGLDGNLPEADCKEGLHAVVLRNLLADEMPDPAVLRRLFNDFSHFAKYTLCAEERSCVRTRLPNLLLVATQSNTEFKKSQLLDHLLDTLAAYKMKFDEFPGVVNAISTAFQEDPKDASHLLRRLFDARVARKELFKENFAEIQNDASYVNALRHDISILDVTTFEKVKTIKEKNNVLQITQFLRKLTVYFSENGGLAERYYALFKLWAETKPNILLARPLAILASKDFTSLLEKLDDRGPMPQLKSTKLSLAKALRDNIHVSRPLVDLSTLGLRNAGIRAAATFASRIPKNQREELIIKELMTWQRTLTLALALTDNEDLECVIYKTLVSSKPNAVFKAFMRYLRKKQFGSGFNTIWNTVKHVITEQNYKKFEILQKQFNNVNISSTIKAEFYMLNYRAHFKTADIFNTLHLLSCLENILYDVDETFIYDILKDFMEHDLIVEKKINKNEYLFMKPSICISIIGKFLLLCCSEETQKRRLETVGEPFFACLEGLWKEAKCRQDMVQYFKQFLLALKYNKVFFDVNYVSCLPVFERVVAWMHIFLPIEKWFVYYSHIQLTMLYYKAARLCVTQQPGYFTGDPSELDKGVEMFGATFGKLVARAYEELNAKYFNSTRVLYKKHLKDFLKKNINRTNYDESKEKFVIAFLTSILEEVEAKGAHFLACYVFTQHKFKYNFDVNKIENIFKESHNEELRICYNYDKECPDKILIPLQSGEWMTVVEASSESESDSYSESEWD